jgi:hypothetical protein
MLITRSPTELVLLFCPLLLRLFFVKMAKKLEKLNSAMIFSAQTPGIAVYSSILGSVLFQRAADTQDATSRPQSDVSFFYNLDP